MLERFTDADIVDPKTYADLPKMDALFAELRRSSPVHWTDAEGYRPFWALTKHADIKQVERGSDQWLAEPRSGLFSIEHEQRVKAITGGTNVIRSLPRLDDPEHKIYRSMTEQWFAASSVKSLEERVRALAVECVDRMEELGGECDFVKDVSVWFPLRVIMMILGIPNDEEPIMLRLTQQLFGSTDPELQRSREAFNYFETVAEYNTYFSALTADRRKNPRDDLATIIANGRMPNGDFIADWEANSYYMTMAAAGHDTTSSTIAGGLLALIENPAEFEKLEANPRYFATATEEMLRWVTPLRQFMRTAINDTVLRDQPIKAGEAVMLCYPSANRDEDVFDDPFRFKVDRTPNPQLSFGYGVHLCLGLILARMEIKSFYQELLDRFEGFELAGEPAWVETNFVGGLKRLPIRYRSKRGARTPRVTVSDVATPATCPVDHRAVTS
jgi:cytochrome P450